MLEVDSATLKKRLTGLPKAQQMEALLYLFKTWDVQHREDLEEYVGAAGLTLRTLVMEAAVKAGPTGFDALFQRAEEWEGFHGNELRIALIQHLARRMPAGGGAIRGDEA